MLLSGCPAPAGFDADVVSKTQNTLNQYVHYEADNCSCVVGEGGFDYSNLINIFISKI